MSSEAPHILILPDSFKGSLSSEAAGTAIRLGILDEVPLAKVEVFQMADGGEGSSEIAARAAGAKRIELHVRGPEADPVKGFYFLDGPVAYIELAAASGLTLVKNLKTSARRATTFGTGELIADALNHGAKKLYLFVGGSATTDGGVGIAKALGYRFLDAAGAEMPNAASAGPKVFHGERLLDISQIIPPGEPVWKDAEIVVVGDVENPLCGPRGAAAVYGPQKGATPEDVAYLDSGLRNLSDVVKRDLGAAIEALPGTGAAGGSCYGMMCFCGAKRLRGASFFLDSLGFDQRLPGISLIVTGEGCVDRQSVEGKVLAEIYRRSEPTHTPILSLSGISALSMEDSIRHPRLIAFGLGHRDGLTAPAEALRALTRNAMKIFKMPAFGAERPTP